jgi:hypothetical protein
MLGFMVHVPHRMAHLAHGNGGDHESTWPRHVFQATEGSERENDRTEELLQSGRVAAAKCLKNVGES